MTKKAGRPKTPVEQARAPGVSVRLNPDELKTINAAISRSGLRQSEFLRKSLLYVAQNDIRIT
jgi:hypothetical protein